MAYFPPLTLPFIQPGERKSPLDPGHLTLATLSIAHILITPQHQVVINKKCQPSVTRWVSVVSITWSCLDLLWPFKKVLVAMTKVIVAMTKVFVAMTKVLVAMTKTVKHL